MEKSYISNVKSTSKFEEELQLSTLLTQSFDEPPRILRTAMSSGMRQSFKRKSINNRPMETFITQSPSYRFHSRGFSNHRITSQSKTPTSNIVTGVNSEIERLDNQSTSKEIPIFITENGTYARDTEKLNGFQYNLPIRHVFKSAEQLQSETAQFLDTCEIKLRKSGRKGKFRYIFTKEGRLCFSLDEVPVDSDLIFVSRGLQFIGVQQLIKSTMSPQSSARPLAIPSIQRPIMSLMNRRKTLATASQQTRSPPRLPTSLSPVSSKSDPINRSLDLRRNAAQLTPKPRKRRLEQPWLKIKPMPPKTDYVKSNAKLYMCPSFHWEKTIDTVVPPLAQQPIGELMGQFAFSRKILHKLYGQYKCLLSIAASKDPEYKIENGIDRTTFVECMQQFTSYNPELLELLFSAIDVDHNQFIDWQEFLAAMSTLEWGTAEQKVELFFRLYDKDGNGCLSFDEIRNLCRIQIAGNLKAIDYITEDLSEMFTKTIFDLVPVKYHMEISLEQMKKSIFSSKNEELYDLFIM